MSKQINKFTAVALGAAGAGAALALTNKHRQENAKRGKPALRRHG